MSPPPTLPDRVAQLARDRPDAPAVVDTAGVLTYGELGRAVDGLAIALIERGIEPDARVGLACSRSRQLVVGVLGIMRAGAAFVPLSASNPLDRLAFIAGDAGLEVVCVDGAGEALVTPLGIATLRLDSCPPSELEPGRPLPARGGLAYVIYTSGTTGTPKGVLVEHGGLANSMAAGAEACELAPGSRMLAHANIGFDAFVFELAAAFATGGVSCLPPPAAAGRELLRWIDEHAVDVAWFPPSLLAALPDEPLPGLRTIIVAGEVCPPDVARRWGRGRRFFNGYGPTEATICTSIARCDPDAVDPRLPIGRPVRNVRCYVLDPEGQPVPHGAEGELYVGGAGVARGYLNRPDLTAERFLPDPFAAEPGARMYRTGDLVRWLDDGQLDFLGRIDHQVQIRGHRVELEEVEAVLREQPHVGEAVVSASEAHPTDARLVAHLTSADGERPAEPDLRTHCAQALPGYMVPARFVWMDRLPLTANGKIDRSALPDPPPVQAGAGAAPRNDWERGVADVWSELLGVAQLGCDDDFFALGGTSLVALQATARVRRRFSLADVHEPELLRALLMERTLGATAASAQRAAATPAVDHRTRHLRRDAELDATVAATIPSQRPAGVNQVLVTGAAGFLGGHLVADLLATTTATVHCHLRADSPGHAWQRLRGRLARTGVDLDRDGLRERIVPVVGDLAQPRLGLDAKAFDDLARTVDLIVHNGSHVNFVYPYEALRETNVGGTLEVIRLASSRTLKPVHYVSTLAIAVSEGLRGVDLVDEAMPLTQYERMYLGYAETKWVAERLLAQACERGVPVSIYRPHDIGGDSATGYWPTERTFLCAIFEFVARLGIAPKPGYALDLIPVDVVARAINHIAVHAPARGDVFHLCPADRTPLDAMVDVLRERGYAIRYVPYDEWVEAISADARSNPIRGLAPFARLFAQRCPGEEFTLAEMYREDNVPLFDDANAQDALAGSGIAWPEIDGDLLGKYADHFIASGFFPVPRAMAGAEHGP